MNSTHVSRRTVLACASMLTTLGTKAQTIEWPTRQSIRLVIPGPPGGAMDIFAKLVQVPLQNALNQSIVMDFKPGANSLIGLDALVKAAPDGYTIAIAPSSAISINPLMIAKMPFDVNTDLVPVAQMGTGGILLMTNPNTGFKSLKDMVAYAKANPGKLAYGSWGNGSTGHLVMEGIKAHFGLDMPHVPYKTTAQEVTDLMGNNLSIAFTDNASPLPHIKSGKLIALATTGASRAPALPDLPTVTEQGYKFDSVGWFGIFAPAGTPATIIARLNQEIGKAMSLEETKNRFTQQNMAIPPHKNAAQFASTVKADIEIWQSLAKKANLKPD
jgi:tripartite-type tricarboxylate transporter receptor subunit TctC